MFSSLTRSCFSLLNVSSCSPFSFCPYSRENLLLHLHASGFDKWFYTFCLLIHFVFVVGSILILVSVALLRGPLSHIKHMISMERLPFTVSYVGSMILTLYAALGVSVGVGSCIGKGC